MTASIAHSILLDAEGLSAIARHDTATQAWERFAVETGSTFYVSAATLAEATDGSARDAGVRRVVRTMCRLEPVSGSIGYVAGGLRARSASSRRKQRDLTVDALVAATATTLPRPVVVLTSDAADLTSLLDGTGIKVHQL